MLADVSVVVVRAEERLVLISEYILSNRHMSQLLMDK